MSRSRLPSLSLLENFRPHPADLDFGADVNSSDPQLSSSPPEKLHYAPRPALLRRLRRARWLAGLAILLLLILSPIWVRPAWQRLELIYWQRECLTHPIAPGTVVYSSGPPAVSVVSTQWSRLSVLIDPFMRPSSAIVYLGQRVTADGTRRLVAVTASSSMLHDDIILESRAIEFGGIYNPPTVTYDVTNQLFADTAPSSTEPVPKQPLFIIYSAIEDPTNPAHFNFCLVLGDDTYSCDCWLQAGGAIRMDRTVSARPNTTPSTAPAR